MLNNYDLGHCGILIERIFTMLLCYAWFWGFCHEVYENYPVFGYYVAISSNILPKFGKTWVLTHEDGTVKLFRNVGKKLRIIFCLTTRRAQFARLCYLISTRWCSWSRPCTTSRKSAVSIPDGVIGIFHWLSLSDGTMVLGPIQPVTEICVKPAGP